MYVNSWEENWDQIIIRCTKGRVGTKDNKKNAQGHKKDGESLEQRDPMEKPFRLPINALEGSSWLRRQRK